MGAGDFWVIKKLPDFCKGSLSETRTVWPFTTTHISSTYIHAVCDRTSTYANLSRTYTTQTETLKSQWRWSVCERA